MATDSNELLEELRKNAGVILDNAHILPNLNTDLARNFLKLDMHLLEGGALPDGWALNKFSKSR